LRPLLLPRQAGCKIPETPGCIPGVFRIETEAEPLYLFLSRAAHEEIKHDQPGIERLGYRKLRGVKTKQDLYKFCHRPNPAPG
jgi:hypothetical protein